MTSLPPLIMTSEKGSFARETIEERKPKIIERILSHFDYNPAIREDLLSLKSELRDQIIQFLDEETSDQADWNKALEPWAEKTWLEIPWFLAETYFFRRVLQAVRYFQPGPWMGNDPYARLKENEIAKGLGVFNETFQPAKSATLEDFTSICYRVLWGNRGDLSNLDRFEINMDEQPDQIVIDDVESVFRYLKRKNHNKIAYILDNIGSELYFDLAMMDYLLLSGFAGSITCYLKNQPFYVSDAMPDDLFQTLERMSASDLSNVSMLAERISQAIRAGIISLEAPPFFTSSAMYREMPEILRSQISKYDLTILKGDVNYRRLVGDRHWEPTTPVSKAAGYFPSSWVSFRTLKSELILGLSHETYSKLERESESDWLTNGQRGMITFLEK